MPKGQPKAGFRMTRNRINSGFNPVTPVTPAAKIVKILTTTEIEKKLKDRFAALEIMAAAACEGHIRSLIVSGPPGLGKSYTVERKVEEMSQKGRHVTTISGYIRPLSLYTVLYNARREKSIVVLDDADSIFNDENAFNILKKACDSTNKRIIHWMSQAVDDLEDEDGEPIPNHFEFKGSIVFITNIDMQEMSEKGSKMAPHFSALISRSHYLDLEMKERLDYLVRIRQVVEMGMLRDKGMKKSEEHEILEFIEINVDKFRELSLRVVVKISSLMKMTSDWKKIAKQTCMKETISC